ncbi:chemotaxis protein CheW [Thiomicrorhabdus sp.]|uniref:chemotaxis protein CheW n=1 Tax=Thiomicrorhabdus sp. TaxID=2039724 RepID=UPI0029C67157|nr:chemotaxis protein CheW [Thiomicrorhabdus sp.]
MQELENTTEFTQGSDDDQVLSFRLGGEEYAVDILRVQEIKGWEKTTSIPNTPDFVMGVINLRGAVVPIIDLRVRFRLDKVTYNESTVVIIVRSFDHHGTQKIIGLVVDGVSDVHSIRSDQLQNAPEMNGVINSSYLKGLATLDDKMVIVLNIDHLINEGILGDILASN